MEHYYEEVDRAYSQLSGPQLEQRLLALTEQCRLELGEDSLPYASMLSELGGFYRGQRQLERSETLFLKAKKIFLSRGAQSTTDYATVLNNLGGTYRLEGKYRQARACFAECLELYQNTVGQRHILYASALNNLSLIELDLGHLDQAEAWLRESSQLLAQMPEYKDELASCLCNLGALSYAKHQIVQAKQYLQKAIDLFEGELGTDTPHYHAALDQLGLVCYSTGAYEQAAAYFQRAGAAALELYGPEHPEYAAIQSHLDLAQRRMEAGK